MATCFFEWEMMDQGCWECQFWGAGVLDPRYGPLQSDYRVLALSLAGGKSRTSQPHIQG